MERFKLDLWAILFLPLSVLAGAGKTESTEYLMKKPWPKVYFGQVVMDEVSARNLPVNEANERNVREELRASTAWPQWQF